MKFGWMAAALCASLMMMSQDGFAASAPGKVSYLKGKAWTLRSASKHADGDGFAKNAPWKAIKKGSRVAEGSAVKVADGGRLELTLADGSRVRLAGGATMTFDEGKFKGKKRNVTLRMWVGKMWASVAKKLGGGSTFEVKTQNAVAGVRGTSFAVVARSDLSAVVKVYAGSVGVTKNLAAAPGGKNRVQIAGPKRINRKQWEEVILSQMQQVTISAVGEIQPAEDFVDEGDELQWTSWNLERDGGHP